MRGKSLTYRQSHEKHQVFDLSSVRDRAKETNVSGKSETYRASEVKDPSKVLSLGSDRRDSIPKLKGYGMPYPSLPGVCFQTSASDSWCRRGCELEWTETQVHHLDNVNTA